VFSGHRSRPVVLVRAPDEPTPRTSREQLRESLPNHCPRTPNHRCVPGGTRPRESITAITCDRALRTTTRKVSVALTCASPPQYNSRTATQQQHHPENTRGVGGGLLTTRVRYESSRQADTNVCASVRVRARVRIKIHVLYTEIYIYMCVAKKK
jgi:hypothetical protein